MTDPMAALQAEMQAVCREALDAAWATRLAPLARALVVGRALRLDAYQLDKAVSQAAQRVLERAVADALVTEYGDELRALASQRAARVMRRKRQDAARQTTMGEVGE